MQEKIVNIFLHNRKLWSWLGKFTITFLALFYVGLRLKEEGFHFSWRIDSQTYYLLMAAAFLLPLNLGLEAKKWEVLQKEIDPSFSFFQAFKGVLIGMSLGLFTPNRVGEYMGRLMTVSSQHRWEAGSFTLINRLSQMLITLVLGLLGWMLMEQQSAIGTERWVGIIKWSSLVLLLGLLGFFCLKKKWAAWVDQFFPSKKGLKKALYAFSMIRPALLGKVWGLSLFRYIVFSTQYLLVLYACGALGGWGEMALLVVLVFLIKSLAPIASLAELGIREAVAVMVAGWLGISGIVASTSAFSLYLINLVLPALIGLLLLYREKS